MHFEYTVTYVSSTGINFKLKFDNPFEISQQSDPEKIMFVMDMKGVTDSDGLKFTDKRNSVQAWIPRQIADEAEAQAIESAGEDLSGASTGVMAGNFIISLLMAASLNQLWSMIGGLQLTVHLPLFSVYFPANANFFITFIIEVATFDIMPPEATDWLLKFP